MNQSPCWWWCGRHEQQQRSSYPSSAATQLTSTDSSSSETSPSHQGAEFWLDAPPHSTSVSCGAECDFSTASSLATAASVMVHSSLDDSSSGKRFLWEYDPLVLAYVAHCCRRRCRSPHPSNHLRFIFSLHEDAHCLRWRGYRSILDRVSRHVNNHHHLIRLHVHPSLDDRGQPEWRVEEILLMRS